MLKKITDTIEKQQRPVRVLQYGEGNFLRGFVDYMLDILNEKGLFDGGVAIAKPIAHGNLDAFHEQDCLYTVSLRGLDKGEPVRQTRLVSSVVDAVDAIGEYPKYAAYATLDTLRFVVSNTTEAGIVYDATDRIDLCPPNSFPGKLTKLLYERYRHFDGDRDKGLVMLPVELIDDNGIMLKSCVMRLAALWELETGFVDWLNEACVFASTLVDRIITGYPKGEEQAMWDDFGYEDRLMVTGEPFALWVIESDRDISGELRFAEAGLPVIFTDNQKPYKQRKVRILNGAHTGFVPASYLMGNDDVLGSMNDPQVRDFMRGMIFDEVIPTLDLPRDDLLGFADAVLDRFSNPFVKHLLLSITLNSVAKWRARCMPSLLESIRRTGAVPKRLAFSLAALMAFYTGGEIRDGALVGHRDGQEYKILDDAPVLQFFADNSARPSPELARAFLGNADFFGQDLTQQPGLLDAVTQDLEAIRAHGMRAAMQKMLEA